MIDRDAVAEFERKAEAAYAAMYDVRPASVKDCYGERRRRFHGWEIAVGEARRDRVRVQVLHSRLDCGPTSARRIYSHKPTADRSNAGGEYLVDAPAVEIDDLETPAESFDVFTG